MLTKNRQLALLLFLTLLPACENATFISKRANNGTSSNPVGDQPTLPVGPGSSPSGPGTPLAPPTGGPTPEIPNTSGTPTQPVPGIPTGGSPTNPTDPATTPTCLDKGSKVVPCPVDDPAQNPSQD